LAVSEGLEAYPHPGIYRPEHDLVQEEVFRHFAPRNPGPGLLLRALWSPVPILVRLATNQPEQHPVFDRTGGDRSQRVRTRG
jgi:hypothetical protein